MKLDTIISNYAKQDQINVHAIVYDSFVNGPGRRMVVWFRGCPFHCKGCFNKDTWNFHTKRLMTISELAELICTYDGDGVTFSGGEPMVQAPSFLKLLCLIEMRNFPKGIMCFTGCEMEEIEATPIIQECMKHIDLTVVGRYEDALRQYSNIAGSSNQQFVFLDQEGRGKAKIATEEIEIDQDVEVHQGENNTLQITGFPDIDREKLRELGITIISE